MSPAAASQSVFKAAENAASLPGSFVVLGNVAVCTGDLQLTFIRISPVCVCVCVHCCSVLMCILCIYASVLNSVAEVLEKHGLQKPISYVRNSQNSEEEAHQLMVKLCRHTGRRYRRKHAISFQEMWNLF